VENNLSAISMIQAMGIFGHALLPDLKHPMIATRDIGNYAAERILKLDSPAQANARVARRTRYLDE